MGGETLKERPTRLFNFIHKNFHIRYCTWVVLCKQADHCNIDSANYSKTYIPRHVMCHN